MKLTARGGTWQVHFTDSSGLRQRLSTRVKVDPRLPDKGKASANLAALDRMREHLMGDVPADVRREAGRGRTLAYALNRSFDERWSEQRSRREKRYLIDKVIRDNGYWPLASITYARLQDYGRELAERGEKPATRNRKMSAIHTALKDAHLRGELEVVPPFPHYTEDNIRERYLTLDEERTLAASMDAHAPPGDDMAQYMRRMVPLLLDTGLRAGEVVVEASQDLGDTLWLPHGTTKNRKGRSVPLTPRARAALDYILASPAHAAMLRFKAEDKNKPSRIMGTRFRLACERAEIADVTLHTLRHTCASRMVQAGVSLYVVKEILGHSSITITERYAHLAPKNLHAAALALASIGAPDAPAADPEVAHRVDESGRFIEGNHIHPT